MPSRKCHQLAIAAVTGALLLPQAVALAPATAAAATVTNVATSLPARPSSVPSADQISGSGQVVVWSQQTSADARPHGWLATRGGTPQDLGPLADTADTVQVAPVSVQNGVVAVATSTNPNGALADHVTLRHLDSGAESTLSVDYDRFGEGTEHYRGQAGDGILVEQNYLQDSAYRARLLLRTPGNEDRTLLSDDSQYEVLASDANGALVLRKNASWQYVVVYVDFASSAVVTVDQPASQVLPQGLEFTPSRVGFVDGAVLTEWQRSAPDDGPSTVTLPVDGVRWISDDTLAWYSWSPTDGGNELFAMSRDGSTPAADLGGTFTSISVGDDGRMRVSLYRPDTDARIQTLVAGRVSTAAGDATTIPAGPARLDAMALSGGTLYTSDDSSRRDGVLLASDLSVGAAGASAGSPSRVLAYSSGLVHSTLAAAGGRVLTDQDSGYEVYQDGKRVGVALPHTADARVVAFDGQYVLSSDPASSAGPLLQTVSSGASRHVPGGSALDGGALYTSASTANGSGWSIRRTDLATGTVSTVATVNCQPGDLQVRGSWILATPCGAPFTSSLLLKAGSTFRMSVDASVQDPILGTNVLYTFGRTDSVIQPTLSAQVLGVAGATARPLFVLPDRPTSVSADRWAVDRDAPWAAWMSTDGVTHVVWAGAPTRSSTSAPTGFSPNGDGSADTWNPAWWYNRPVTWTLTLKAGTTLVRSLSGTASDGLVKPVWTGTTDSGAKAAEGSYTWTLTAKDTVTSVPATAVTGSVVLRRKVPTASVKAPTVAATASTTAQVPVTWSATTPGVKSYDVAWKVATRSTTGVWKLGPLQTWRTGTTTTSAVFGKSGSPVKPVAGLTYRFYVRAHDDAGQTGPWSPAALSGIPVDDRSSALLYKGTWKSVTAASAWAGTERTSATTGAYVSFSADGTQLRIVATRKADGGRFAVVVDGTTVGTVNTYAAKTAYRQVVFTCTLGSTIKTHKVQLRVLPGSASGRSTVHLDAVMITR
ncbi:hypothetical protein [Streptomyces sp. NPDC001070]